MRRARLRIALLWGAAFTAIGLLQFTHYYLNVLAAGRSERVLIKLVEEMTAAYGAGVCLLPCIALARRAERLAWPLAETLAAHGGAVLAFSVAHTVWNWGTRTVIFPLAGLGAYDYGRMPVRFAMELPSDILFYTLIMGLLYLFDRYRSSRDKELRLAHVESELTRVRLGALEGQLRPHFLFNALNTISAVMYEDLAAADTMLTRLADLLRHTLRRQDETEVVLAEELETLELYLSIMRARFADRLAVEVEVDPEARRALVPPLVLQPLVENALRHGAPGTDQAARVAVRARRDDGRLWLEVEDNGPGIAGAPADALGRGLGLSATARRLAAQYGAAAGLTLENGATGGARASVFLPYRERP